MEKNRKKGCIEKDISEKVLAIGPSLKAKGGIAIVVSSFSKYFEIFHHIPTTHSSSKIQTFLSFCISITKLVYFILFRGIKIIHIHGASYGSFIRKSILIHISKLLGAKVIYHIHGGGYKIFYSKYNKCNFIKYTLRKTDKLVVLSRDWYNFFSGIVDSSKISILNNIVMKPQGNILCKKVNQGEIIKILFLGKIGEGKGIYDLINVIQEKKEFLKTKVKFFLGGDGEVEILKKMIDINGLEDLVNYVGWVDGTKKEDLLQNNHIYILPSYKEGLPISILEAMSYGMPIISTYVGGIPEIVTDKENGLLITPGDKKALIESIRYFVDKPDEIGRMGENSLKIVEEFYPESVIPQLNEIYQSLLVRK